MILNLTITVINLLKNNMKPSKINVIDNVTWLSFEIIYPNGQKFVTGDEGFFKIYEVGMEITLNGKDLDPIQTEEYVKYLKS